MKCYKTKQSNNNSMCSPVGRGQMLADKRFQGISADGIAAAVAVVRGAAAAVGILQLLECCQGVRWGTLEH
jgi:hypothetical protein